MNPRGLPIFASPVLQLQMCATTPNVLNLAFRFELGPHACGAKTLPTELSPQPKKLIF